MTDRERLKQIVELYTNPDSHITLGNLIQEIEIELAKYKPQNSYGVLGYYGAYRSKEHNELSIFANKIVDLYNTFIHSLQPNEASIFWLKIEEILNQITKLSSKIPNAPLKDRYNSAVDEYVALFCEKQGLEKEEGVWLEEYGGVGGVFDVAMISFDFRDIKIDVDFNIPPRLIGMYYWEKMTDISGYMPCYFKWWQTNFNNDGKRKKR